MSKERKRRVSASKSSQHWLEELQRRQGTRQLEMRFLIVCEDTKSAFDYFEALVEHFQMTAASIKVAHSSKRTQPIQVVGRAIQLKDNAAADPNSLPFEQVWCIVDGDYGPMKIRDARVKADRCNIKLAISTMCFEYWVLLHFENSTTPTSDCDGVIKSLKRYYPKYDKRSCHFQEIVKHVRVAAGRAKKLREQQIQSYPLPEQHNPCSEIYKLIDAILAESKE